MTDTASAALLKALDQFNALHTRMVSTDRGELVMVSRSDVLGILVNLRASLPTPATAALLEVQQAIVQRLKERAEGHRRLALAYHHSMQDSHNLYASAFDDAIVTVEACFKSASLPAPAAPVIVVQVPDGWRVAQWDGQRYVSIGLPYPTERQANGDCALILARVQPAIESRLP